MKILHTSDWHLGQEFHDFARDHEHSAFLAWLEDRLEEHAVDALLVTGDIFDSQNPPITAQRQLYDFVAQVARRMPALDVVLIGGNHDSAGRLEAPRTLLESFGVRVVGSLPRGSDGRINPDHLLFPLTDSDGEAAVLCAAVPFLRLPDLPPAPQDEADGLIWGVRRVYEEVLALAAERRTGGQHLVVTGHCYMTATEISDLSERRILGGNQHALPADIFPDDIAYVALGHLHKPQMVGGRSHVRYAGSPLPLSVAERDYKHQVVLVDLGSGCAEITPLHVPRSVPVLRVPASGAAPVDTVLEQLRALDVGDDRGWEWQPYLHVEVTLDRPAPSLRRDIAEALGGKGVRLAKLAVQAASATSPVVGLIQPDLNSLQPEDVFSRRWRRDYEGDPPEDVLGCFRELLEGLETGDAAP
ncbi:exonuclease SbcCD subunit D C-terminal domain-containing protein [Magnetospirillum sulfuroxidans]|uniref:Nuclease SbcCD subunit D n=1 Tax=Magnetospirillum sulfuroxidans TaxID=611300 RepID=A0ABS5IBQ8_9PROT|nr:exonuclease SbcCD subunit D C-terminal domain-containing protein [Magnetospirillum sulfuroxidans]MBR9971183.1 exonuclease SbcCD subunit D C-terminal domain-containing protein [Magnetospirillum sulfuroxidans]